MYKMLLVNHFLNFALMRLVDCEVQMHIAQDKCTLPASLLTSLVQIATNFKHPAQTKLLGDDDIRETLHK